MGRVEVNFNLRPMEERDLDDTFAWRNDPEVLNNAMSPNTVSYAEHEANFKFNNAIKLVFEVDNLPAGLVTITQDSDKPVGEWSFHLNPQFRSKGLSEIMLRIALYYLKNNEGYKGIASCVLKHNKISHHLHEKLEFVQTGMNDKWIEYKLEL